MISNFFFNFPKFVFQQNDAFVQHAQVVISSYIFMLSCSVVSCFVCYYMRVLRTLQSVFANLYFLNIMLEYSLLTAICFLINQLEFML